MRRGFFRHAWQKNQRKNLKSLKTSNLYSSTMVQFEKETAERRVRERAGDGEYPAPAIRSQAGRLRNGRA